MRVGPIALWHRFCALHRDRIPLRLGWSRATLWAVGILWCGLGGALAMAQQPTPDDPVRELDSIRTAHGLPGLIAGHFSSTGEPDLIAVGERRSGSRETLQLDDRMHLGSCTKSMTAVLIGLLIDEGKLRWDTTLAEVFADDPRVVNSDWSSATVEQLLHHVSGAPANPPWGNFDDSSIPVIQQRRNILHWMTDQPRKPESIGAFVYSNLGYMVLGHILEAIRGHAWEREIQERLFEPLGIQSAGFGPPSKTHGDGMPWGHRNVLGVILATDFDNPPALGPAGTVHMSLPDWIRYLRLHLLPDSETSSVNWEPPIPLRRETMRALHTPAHDESYAGGWIVSEREWAGGRILTHNGSNTFWFCVVFLAPEQKRGVLSASNYGLGAAQACDEALQWMLRKHSADAEPR